MKRKLIEVTQETLITCDNKTCDFKIENPTKDPNIDTAQYVNMPCPKCGENLLTYEDYATAARLLKSINWFNKWFSWPMYLIPKKRWDARKTSSVHCHNGVKVTSSISDK